MACNRACPVIRYPIVQPQLYWPANIHNINLAAEMLSKSTLCLFLCMLALPKSRTQVKNSKFLMISQWNKIDFAFPSEEKRQEAIDKQYFVSEFSIPIDVDVQHRNGMPSRIFVTLPRFDVGRAITLGTVGHKGIIQAYPSYEWHDNQGENCDGMTSVFRTAIDNCNRIWVLDTGRINTNFTCAPQLLAFNLEDDSLVFRHRISQASLKPLSLLITPIVDIGASCEDVFIYLADVEQFGLVVVDAKGKKDWRVNHRLFFPYPSHGTFTIQGLSFQLMDGVLGMAISPKSPYSKNRKLFFHALASTTENYVNTKDLKNESIFLQSDAPAEMIQVFPMERDSQSGAEAIDKDGIMYFGLMEPPRVACWNTRTEFRPENIHIIAEDHENLQFISGMKIINNLKGVQELWVFAVGFQRYMTNNLFKNSPNYKISAASINDLIEGTPCSDPKGYSGPALSGNAILR